METPNITQAQLYSAIVAVLGQLVAWGLVSNDNGQLAISGAATVLPAIWTLADLFIRRARANNAGAILSARELYGPPAPPAFGSDD